MHLIRGPGDAAIPLRKFSTGQAAVARKSPDRLGGSLTLPYDVRLLIRSPEANRETRLKHHSRGRCRGNCRHIPAWLNGVKTIDVVHKEGFLDSSIGLQLVHGKKHTVLDVKTLLIREAGK